MVDRVANPQAGSCRIYLGVHDRTNVGEVGS
jgi:hypothetical protein